MTNDMTLPFYGIIVLETMLILIILGMIIKSIIRIIRKGKRDVDKT